VSQIKLTASQLKTVKEYCKLNNIEDVDKFITKCYTEGFNIKKYGLMGDDSGKSVEIEVIKEIQVEVPVEVIKEVYITDNEELERLKKLVEIYSIDQFNTNEEIIELIEKNKSLKKQFEEVSQDKIGDEPKSNDKINLLQETLQKLRKELTDKNSRITELEEINKRLESIKVSQGAVYLKGSNISETL
jgi:predicted RNase H-like nuclease (RuvC/YqgF family)